MTHEMTDQLIVVSLANDGGNEAELTDQKVQSHGWVRIEEQGKETFSIIVANDGSYPPPPPLISRLCLTLLYLRLSTTDA
ncbi:unnamed protein product [Brassica oleracea]